MEFYSLKYSPKLKHSLRQAWLRLPLYPKYKADVLVVANNADVKHWTIVAARDIVYKTVEVYQAAHNGLNIVARYENDETSILRPEQRYVVTIENKNTNNKIPGRKQFTNTRFAKHLYNTMKHRYYAQPVLAEAKNVR